MPLFFVHVPLPFLSSSHAYSFHWYTCFLCAVTTCIVFLFMYSDSRPWYSTVFFPFWNPFYLTCLRHTHSPHTSKRLLGTLSILFQHLLFIRTFALTTFPRAKFGDKCFFSRRTSKYVRFLLCSYLLGLVEELSHNLESNFYTAGLVSELTCPVVRSTITIITAI